MKLKTYQSIVEEVKKCLENGATLSSVTGLNFRIYTARNAYKDGNLKSISELENLISEYKKSHKNTQDVDNDQRSSIEYILNDDGKIIEYKFTIYTKDKLNIAGSLTREEMERIYGMYSRYGANLSQAVVYQEFPRWSYVEFQRILRALQITKNGQLPEHLKRELSQEEQENYYKNLRASNARKNFDAQRFKYLESDYKKVLFENETLKNKLNSFKDIEIPDINIRKSTFIPTSKYSTNNLMLHLSDWHIGAAMCSGSLYDNPWNEELCRERLNKLIQNICDLHMSFDTIVINNLGDCLDGIDNMTARRDHLLPQNMDNREMTNSFIRLFVEFVSNLYETNVANNIKIYSVPNGNHCEITEYLAIKTALNVIKVKYPSIETTQFEQTFGYYKFNNKDFLILHGKDGKFAKKPFPLNCTTDTKCRIEDYLRSIKYDFNNKIYVIKGDLHTANLNSDYSMDYRNVLSLYGASDYANENYCRNNSGVSYTLFIGDELIRGEFNNLTND